MNKDYYCQTFHLTSQLLRCSYFSLFYFYLFTFLQNLYPFSNASARRSQPNNPRFTNFSY